MTKDDAKAEMRKWYLANYEDPAESTPVDDGEYVYIWGDPEAPEDTLTAQYYGTYPEAWIDELAAELEAEFDIYMWVPVPTPEPLSPDDDPENLDHDEQHCCVAMCEECAGRWIVPTGISPELLKGICPSCDASADAKRPLVFRELGGTDPLLGWPELPQYAFGAK